MPAKLLDELVACGKAIDVGKLELVKGRIDTAVREIYRTVDLSV